ncbi:MAG TPA: DUF983 domain-containing protein [Allosphingosinicella sp.]
MEGTEPTPVQVSLGGLCPRCGAKTLFAGFARFAASCRACGLDFTAFNVGDGPAAFLTLGIGALVTGLAIALELISTPPWWVHVLIWLPLTVAMVMGSLRYSKGALLALEYRHRAREGQIVRGDEP